MPEYEKISRRTAMALGVGSIGWLAAPKVLRAATPDLVIVSSGGALEDAYKAAIYDPWTAKTGGQITTGPNTPAKLKAMVEAGAMEWDVAQMDATVAASAARDGLLEPLDYSIIDKDSILPGMGREYYLASDLAGTVLAWNSDALQGKEPPADWREMWDLGTIAGKRGILKRASQTLEIALMADGVSPADLYPLDVERGLKSLEKIKDGIFWWESGAQGAQILIDGEVPLSMEWVGRVEVPKQQGAKVDYHLNQALYASDSWVVPKGTKNKKTAMEFIAFAVAAEQQLAYSKLLPYGPVSLEAIKRMDSAQLANSPSNPEIFAKGVMMDFDWWAENNQKVTEQFNKWSISI